MATIEDEFTKPSEVDAGALDTSQTITVPQRQSPGPMLHDVWRVDEDALYLVAEAVEVKARGAAGRREAVALATALRTDFSDEQRYGTFRTVKHGEMSDPIVRAQKIEPVDVWS